MVRKFQGSPRCLATGWGWAGLVEEQDANGNIRTYTWDLPAADSIQKYLLKVTDEVGRVTNYGYEKYSCPSSCYYRVKSITDPYGRVVTFTYDASGNVATVQNAAGLTTQHTYQSGLLTGVTNARGHPTTISWTGTTPNRVAKVTAPDTSATTYTYDATAGTTTVTDARANSTVYTISSAGDVVKTVDPLGNTATYVYDDRHNLTQVTDALGRITNYAYNSRNKITQIVQTGVTPNLTTALSWDDYDNLLSVTNPRGIVTNYTYDTKHNLTSVRQAVGTTDEALTQFTYTTWGGVASVTDPRGGITIYAYTPRRQIQTVTPPAGGTTSFTYNTFDDQVTMTNGNGQAWTAAYDARRLVTSATDPLTNKVTHEYDANGNQTRTVDAKLQATTFAYDSQNRLTSITDPLNGVTRYEYDVVSNLTRIINARTHPTTFTYDAANRLTQVTDALLQTTTYGYDAAGNRTSMRDRKGATHSYAYDQVNRLTQVSAGGLTISHAYDANSNRTSMTDGNGTTSYTYDTLDRLTRTTTPDGRFVAYAFDRNGNRIRLTYPDGSTTLAYAYDAADRLTQLTQGTLTWSLSYDPAGNRTAIAQPNGTRTDYAYLTNNWLQSITHKRPDGATFQSFTYGYDASGNRVSQADGTGTTTFTYDALHRLTAGTYPGTYGSWSWAYDAVGNRTSQTAPSGTTPYTYDANNRLTTAGAVNYSYDANGNLTSTTAGQSFSWDVFNRLTGASGSGGSVSYTYNGDALKLRRTGPDGATVYYYDGIRPIWEADGAGTPRVQLDRDIFGNLLSRREVSSGVRRYFAHDGLGGLTGVTDEGGTHVASLFYDAWGNLRATGGTWTAGNYQFTGAELDPATGLYHMGARFYDPAIGRWLSEDSVQSHHFDPRSLNFYAYVANNPLRYTDPAGMMPTEGETGSVPSTRTWAETVVEWVREFGVAAAQDMARQAWQALNAILDVLASPQYGDANLTGSLIVGLMGGIIYDAQGQVYLYAGATVGFGVGFAYTISAQTVTPGWNIAVSGTVPGGLAFQVGTALECKSACHYLEVGVSTPVPAATLAVFKVWAIRRRR